MIKIGIYCILFLIAIPIMGQEYKEPTQQYYQHEDVSNNDDVAIIAGNLFFITLANYIDSRMSIYGKQQHTFLITSLIICGIIDCLYKFKPIMKKKKKEKNDDKLLIRSRF